MPSPTETKRLIQEIVTDNGRTLASSIVRERTTDSILNDAKIGMNHTRITLNSDLQLVASVDSASKGGGAKVFTFPAGYVSIHGARISGSIGTSVADLTSTAGEIGLGTVVGTGAVSVLGGTAGFEDILQGGLPALGNVTADTDLAVKAGSGIRAGQIGSFSAGAACFLNLASAWGNVATAANVVARSGMVIDIYWSIIEA